MSNFDEEWALETLAVRAGQVRTAEGEHVNLFFLPQAMFSLVQQKPPHVLVVKAREIYIRVLPTQRFALLNNV